MQNAWGTGGNIAERVSSRMLTLMVTIDCPVSVETMGFGGGVADDLVDPGVRVLE